MCTQVFLGQSLWGCIILQVVTPGIVNAVLVLVVGLKTYCGSIILSTYVYN